MKIPDIGYKQILGSDGEFIALEIWQAGKHITLQFKNSTFDSTEHSNYWDSVKKTVDTLQEKVKREAEVQL